MIVQCAYWEVSDGQDVKSRGPVFSHHVTQRGNRRHKAFFCVDDYLYYIELIAEVSKRTGAEVWAYYISSARADLEERDDGLVRVQRVLVRVGNWRDYLAGWSKGVKR